MLSAYIMDDLLCVLLSLKCHKAIPVTQVKDDIITTTAINLSYNTLIWLCARDRTMKGGISFQTPWS